MFPNVKIILFKSTRLSKYQVCGLGILGGEGGGEKKIFSLNVDAID